MTTHPLDPHAARPGSDIPQQPPGDRHQGGEHHRSDLPLGDLSVMLERLVGQTGGPGQQDSPRLGTAFDCDDRQWIMSGARPFLCDTGHKPLIRAPQPGQRGHGTRPEAPPYQQRTHRVGQVRLRRQHQDPTTRLDRGMQHRQRAPDGADDFDILYRPPQASACQRHRRQRGQHPHPLRPQQTDQRRADPEEHRIATRQHGEAEVLVLVQQPGQRRQEW